MVRLRIKLCFSLIMSCLCHSISAQTLIADTVTLDLSRDTVLIQQILESDTIRVIQVGNDSIPEITGVVVQIPQGKADEKYHSPHRASMYAAIFPGLGQAYNKQYWKIPIVFGGFGVAAYAISFNSERYNYYRGAYRDFIIRDPANKSYLDILKGTNIDETYIYNNADWFQRYLNNSKQRFKKYRDLSYAGLVAWYLLTIIDASIDAHFYYFDVSDDLSFQIDPTYMHINSDIGGTVGLQLRITF